MSKFDFKQGIVGLALLGLVAWNASIQVRVRSVSSVGQADRESVDASAQVHPIGHETIRNRRKRSITSQARTRDVGVVYTRWGLNECPNRDSELIYSGTVGSSRHNETGGSTEYLCLPHHPQYERYTDALEGTGKIYGVEFEVGRVDILENNGPFGLLQDADVMCAVCRANGKTSTVVIPGQKTCFPGWREEYWGYIMTSHYNHLAQFRFACVDAAARGAERGSRSENGGLMYHVQGVCGSLSCPRYVQGRELTCVVCTK